MTYDYLIVGSGLYGATFAYLAHKSGKRVFVIDKRNHIGGNIHCECIEGINVHTYGAHIFHTSNKRVWNFVNSFSEFNRYTNSPIANFHGKLYNMPFNMNTFYELWGVKTPKEAMAKIEEQRKKIEITEPKNLEEQALILGGRDIYEALVKEYTEKQWGRKCTELPAFIIKRIPFRFAFDNNYFNDTYQGIPIGGFNRLIDGLLKDIEVRTNTDFFSEREYFENLAEKIVFTGKIDEFFDYKFGKLEYRTVRFETEILDMQNFQGNAVINYTSHNEPYTRIIEHKHFEPENIAAFNSNKTVISKEFSSEWEEGAEPFYPINDDKNSALYKKYAELAEQEQNVIFGGRLAEYKYYDMDDVIEKAMNDWETYCGLKKYIFAENYGNEKHASSKAAGDVIKILASSNFTVFSPKIISKQKKASGIGLVNKFYGIINGFHFITQFQKKAKNIENQSILFFQYPAKEIGFSGFLQTKYLKLLKRKKHLKFYILIHDLFGLRWNLKREKLKEVKFLKSSDLIISHTDKMKEYLTAYGIEKNKITNLFLFDYLHNNSFKHHHKDDGIVFAGNLGKSEFLRNEQIANINIKLNLYGIGIEKIKMTKNMNYMGSFTSEELPEKIQGGFGLVWDGNSIDTCSGLLGEYLKYNSSHKNSLYIVSRLPIIIWTEAALASFITGKDIGITVASLSEIPAKISKISESHYERMLSNIETLALELEQGKYIKKALEAYTQTISMYANTIDTLKGKRRIPTIPPPCTT